MSEARTEDEPSTSAGPTASARDPEQFGKYWLIDRIAVGGMAEVFASKAFGHAGFEKDLVVKRILRHYSRDPEFVEMFISEAKLCAGLVHPNIVQVFDFGKIQDNYFIAMERVDGKDLKSLMRRLAERGERMPVRMAAYIAYELAKGLDYAHGKTDSDGELLNLVHRDVSPSNVLMGYDGHVKLVDFGIAEVESERERLSESAVLKGKFSYMSPEQVAVLPLDARADQFSLGICLWEMLTGHRLFKAESEPATLARIRACEVQPPKELNPDIPVDLQAIVLKALAQDPNERWRDAASLRKALGNALLPGTPETIRGEVAAFLQERFADEIVDERARLDSGTKRASEWHYADDDLDLDFEEADELLTDPALPLMGVPVAGPEVHADSTESIAPVPLPAQQPAPAAELEPDRGPNGLAYVLLLVLAVVVAAVWLWPKPPPADARLSIAVLPADLDGVVLTLDGAEIPADFDGVTPDEPHTLVVSAPGYLPRERSVELVAGQTFAMEVTLTAEPMPEPEATPEAAPEPRATPRPVVEARPAATPKPAVVKEAPPAATPEPVAQALPPIVYFRSDPPGAEVHVDGLVLGNTPMEWRKADTGNSYAVELRLDGYQTVKARVTGPNPNASIVVSRRLPEKKAEKALAGKVNVQITPGWAKVYIDGAYVSTTPLIGHELPPGTHQLRVLSERLGIDQTETITVRGGETTVKAYSFDR